MNDALTLSHALGALPAVSPLFPEVEQTYILEKVAKWRRDFARLGELTDSFVENGDVSQLEELNRILAWLASPESPLQRELAYVASKLPTSK
jgi:siroheme synthase (precorrin-2 oxidase/ferrochelatase)